MAPKRIKNMLAFGLIDDRKDARESFKIKISLTLEDIDPKIVIIDTAPFKDVSDYVQWILENEISLLIVDERLYEEGLNDGTNVTYSGHDLVNYLRDSFKDLPIYCITNFDRTQELDNSFQAFNLILSKPEFGNKEKEYLNLFVRTARNFYRENSEELQKLNIISTKIALGEATDSEIREAAGIQAKLSLPHSTESINNRVNWLEQFAQQIDSLKAINSSINEFLERRER